MIKPPKQTAERAKQAWSKAAETVSSQRTRFHRLGQVLAALFLVVIVGAFGLAALVAWTDHEWYASVGQSDVFWTTYLSMAVVWTIFATINFAALLAAARLAWRSVGAPGRFIRTTAALTALAAMSMAATMASNWMTFRLAVAQAPFGVTDPLFHLDAGFFVFTLPALELLVAWSFQLVLLAMAGYLTIVLISSRLDHTGQLHVDWPSVRRVFWRLGAVLMVAAAASFGLKAAQLDYSTTQTSFVGASFTDVHAQLPGFIAMATASVVIAVVLLVTAQSQGFKPIVSAFFAMLCLSLIVQSLIPMVVQRYWVVPNEASAEKDYLTSNVNLTRYAYQLDQVSTQNYSDTDKITNDSPGNVRVDLSGTPVWNANTVSQAFNQLQTIRPYYQLSTIGSDRYSIDGKLQQVLVSAREISSAGLPSSGSSWVNRRLVYTHGYGLAISSASQTTKEGFPNFLVGDVPTKVDSTLKTADSLQISQPRIYFGPDQSDWVVVNTGIDEFDYPQGNSNVTNRYASTDGVTLGGPLTRLAWAVRLGSIDLLVSRYLKSDSRILLNRSVVARAQKIAPWLTYDTPYPAVVNGRITWIIDAYTTSDHFPYSQALPNSSPFPNGTNYVRSSVKVTVDAESGDTKFYAVGTDPVRDAWAKIFPTVISTDAIPSAVAAHLRVPTKLFAAQSAVYTKYHVSDPQVFYSQEDLWRIPVDAKKQQLTAQYVLLDPPNSAGTGLYLIQPYVLPNRDDLVGWLTSSSEPNSYGRMEVYELPKSRVTLGAAQVSARINQDPTIAEQLTLWNQPGSTVQFGTMLVLPVDGSTIYLQPIFLKAQSSAITEMAGVIAVNGDRISLGKNLNDALAKAFP